ncbi:MAG: hypothetical protein HY900_22030 [Deltaproteobacteria bacterium]|nr:hypothetical protein [Deltaproteobacteria bacterium]
MSGSDGARDGRLEEEHAEARLVAFHEAAHAVADLKAGFCPWGATILPHEHAAGSSGSVYGFDGTQGEEDGRGWIISLLAGYVASLVAGEEPEQARLAASSDFERAEEAIRILGHGDISSWTARAQSFVREHWQAITAVAEELLLHKTLDDGELDLIVSAAEGDPSADVSRYRALRGWEG